MLVLSRRENERIRVGDSIVVTVLRVSGDKVRLGIKAPADVLVLRDELKAHDSASASPNGHQPAREPQPAGAAAIELKDDASSEVTSPEDSVSQP